MKNVYIYCEGQTEESFVREILSPYFISSGIYVFPIICTTKRTLNSKFKGGVSNYGKIKRELQLIGGQHPHEFVTTMFDYYGMPTDTPGIENHTTDIEERISQIEADIDEDVDLPNCKFHFMIHEFEGILFSNPNSFRLITDDSVVGKIQRIKDDYPTPEHINNSVETAPSKRLEKLIPGYAKIKNGTLLSKDMGIDIIMKECPHFRSWIQSILSF